MTNLMVHILNAVNKGFGLLIIFTLCFTGCNEITVKEAVNQLRSTKYRRTLEIGEFKLELQYIPEILFTLNHSSIDTNLVLSNKLVKDLNRNTSGIKSIRFLMTISPRIDTISPLNFDNDVIYGNLTNDGNYPSNLNDYLFGLGEKIWLEANGKRFSLQNYHMTRSWGMNKSRKFVLLFDGTENVYVKNENEISLVIQDIFPGQGRDKLVWKLPLSTLELLG